MREYSDHPENGLPAFGVPERSTKESDGLVQPPPTNLRDLTQAEVARIEADWWAPSPGRDIQHNLVLTLEEAAFGTEVKIPGFNTVTCDSCGSSGSERANESDICPVCLGVGQVRLRQGGELTHHICPRCHGSGEVIRPDCKDCGGSGRAREKKTNYVNIPGGIESGDRIRLSGEGEVGVHGGPRGDLYLNIQIKPHELFRREGGNLFCETPISRVTAKDGGTIAVPCLEGRVMLRVPAQTTNGTVFRLPGKGIKSVHSSEVGDLMCRVVFEMSQSRLGRERKAVEERGVHGQRKKWIGITTVLIIFFLLLAHFEVI